MRPAVCAWRFARSRVAVCHARTQGEKWQFVVVCRSKVAVCAWRFAGERWRFAYTRAREETGGSPSTLVRRRYWPALSNSGSTLAAAQRGGRIVSPEGGLSRATRGGGTLRLQARDRRDCTTWRPGPANARGALVHSVRRACQEPVSGQAQPLSRTTYRPATARPTCSTTLNNSRPRRPASSTPAHLPNLQALPPPLGTLAPCAPLPTEPRPERPCISLTPGPSQSCMQAQRLALCTCKNAHLSHPRLARERMSRLGGGPHAPATVAGAPQRMVQERRAPALGSRPRRSATSTRTHPPY